MANLLDQIHRIRAQQAAAARRARGHLAGEQGRHAAPMGNERRIAAYQRLGRPGATPAQRRRLAKRDSQWKVPWAPAVWPSADD